MSDRVEARIDNFVVDIEEIDDSIEKSIVEHEFAYRDGAMLEDLGAKAREIKFRCWFCGERFNEHYSFFEHVGKTSDRLYELEHPTYGVMFVKIPRVAPHREASPDTVYIDIECTEELQGAFGAIAPPVDVVDVLAEDAFETGLLQQIGQCAEDLKNAIGAEAQEILSRTLTPGISLIDTFTNVTLAAREILNTIDDAIALAESLCSSITVPANEMVALAEYPSTVPGRIVEATYNVAARYAESMMMLAESPEHFIGNLSTALQGGIDKFSDDDFPFKKHMTISCGMVLALESAYRYDEDEQNRNVLRQLETAPAFSLDGKYLNPPEAPTVMNVHQLEKTLAIVRAKLQSGIDYDRTNTALKALAKILLDHIYDVKLESERIVKRVVKIRQPLHVVCAREGIPYAKAERITGINSTITNPTFTFGEINVYA